MLPDEPAPPVARELVNNAVGVLMARFDLNSHDAYGLLMDTARVADDTVAAVVKRLLRDAKGDTDPL